MFLTGKTQYFRPIDLILPGSTPFRIIFSPHTILDFMIFTWNSIPSLKHIVQIFGANLIKDSFLGRATIKGHVTNAYQCEIALVRKSKRRHETEMSPIRIFVEVATYDNPASL